MAARSNYRVGIDENGLGPRLGPLVVTGVLAEVDDKGRRRLERRLPPKLRKDLDDSKALVSTHNVLLGEAWARAVLETTTASVIRSPRGLLRKLSLQSNRQLRADCPSSTEAQCFCERGERFQASDELMARVHEQLRTLRKLGIVVMRARSEIVCTGRLNALKQQGIHRFAADLHAMERLFLAFRRDAGAPLSAVCGKVGGISRYEPFFGPLAGRLHTTLGEDKAQSAYHFPSLGDLSFVRDADGTNPLVMLSSLVGKYVREVLMARISRYYADHVPEELKAPSGYHDPITNRFVRETEEVRRRLEIVSTCFERVGAR